MRVEFGMVEDGSDSLLQFFADDMFQDIGLFVNFVPTETEGLHQV